MAARLTTTRYATVAGCVIVGALLLPVLLRIGESIYIYDLPADVPHADAILILGASVVHGDPSPILAERADTAIALYRAGAAKRILISGDNGENSYDEVTPVMTYLVAHQIPQKDIFLDRAGFDTYSSMYRARYVFGARTLLIATQDFHLPRAVFIAQMEGIKARGITADGGKIMDYLREIPATWKAVIDIVWGRQPKYLGAPIPLAGRSNFHS